MNQYLEEFRKINQLDKILGKWHSIVGITLEFSSLDGNFLYGKFQKSSLDFEKVDFKAIYSIDDSHLLKFGFISDFNFGKINCRGTFSGVTDLSQKKPMIRVNCVGEINLGKDSIVKQSSWDFTKSLKFLNFEDYPVHEENDFFDPNK